MCSYWWSGLFNFYVSLDLQMWYCLQFWTNQQETSEHRFLDSFRGRLIPVNKGLLCAPNHHTCKRLWNQNVFYLPQVILLSHTDSCANNQYEKVRVQAPPQYRFLSRKWKISWIWELTPTPPPLYRTFYFGIFNVSVVLCRLRDPKLDTADLCFYLRNRCIPDDLLNVIFFFRFC